MLQRLTGVTKGHKVRLRDSGSLTSQEEVNGLMASLTHVVNSWMMASLTHVENSWMMTSLTSPTHVENSWMMAALTHVNGVIDARGE